MSRKGRFPLTALMPVAAVICASWASIPALDIWAHVATGGEYDPWRDDLTVGSMAHALSWGGAAAILAVASMFVKRYRWFALCVLVWTLFAIVLIPLGLRGVRMQPDGQIWPRAGGAL